MDEMALRDFGGAEGPFKFKNLKIIRSREESEAIDRINGPYAIISASGMWFMGRIVRHARNHVEDPNSEFVITGYQVPGRTGWYVEQGREKYPRINIDGKEYDFRASTRRVKGYGAHADGAECVKHVVENVRPTNGAFVAHGELSPSEWTQKQLEARGVRAEVIRKGKIYEL